MLTHARIGASPAHMFPDAFRSICVEMHDIRSGYDFARYFLTKPLNQQCGDSDAVYLATRQKEIASAILGHYVHDKLSYSNASLNGPGPNRRKSQIVMDSVLYSSAGNSAYSNEEISILIDMLLEFQGSGDDVFSCGYAVTARQLTQALYSFRMTSKLWSAISSFFGFILIPAYKEHVMGGACGRLTAQNVRTLAQAEADAVSKITQEMIEFVIQQPKDSFQDFYAVLNARVEQYSVEAKCPQQKI